MSRKTYQGSCHCGAVRIEAQLDFSTGTYRCNCSICTKNRAWFTMAPPEGLKVLQGADALGTYRWKPASKPAPFLTYHFCKHCGVRTHCTGDAPNNGVQHAVQIAVLDNVDADELAAAPINRLDGLHDRFDRAPEDIRLM